MIRAVLDVNALVSGFPAPGSVPGELIDRWLGREFVLITSEHILAGSERAWNSEYFRARYRADEHMQALALLRDRAELVFPATSVQGIADDEEDDLVLATAVAGHADLLVTGDRGLLSLERYEGIAIISPRAFLTMLGNIRLGTTVTDPCRS